MDIKPSVQVSVLNTKHDSFDYWLGEHHAIIGARVWVPFRNGKRLGIIISQHPSTHPPQRLKTILTPLDASSLVTPELLELCEFISHYYHVSLAQVLTLALPKLYRQGRAIIQDNLPLHTLPPDHPLPLHPEQQQAVETIRAQLNHYGCYLLHGVTGSGKTEVYLHLVADVLALNRQVLILVPEIGLTPQLLARVQARFQVPIGVMHSHMTDLARATTWQAARDQRIAIIVGTRSALFTPLPHLGLIIIDEEHDASFKQMDGVRFSARDAALVRAAKANIPIVLGSATPSLESLHNVTLNKYTPLNLTHKALNQTPLYMQLLDIRNQVLDHGLAPATQQLISDVLKQQQQVLIFINRRGFAPVLLCHACGWMADCRACDSHLTLHQRQQTLLCHHCGGKQAIPAHCKHCAGTDLVPVGAGTQRIHQALAARFPNARIVRFDRDEIKTNRTLHQQLELAHTDQADILIGTQMLAKGHHLPHLGLVVILDIDAGFYNQDFRALERLGQLITQVSGRAGRANIPGRVLIQTHLPQHPLLNQLVQVGYNAFSAHLMQLRQDALWPPFSFLALIRAQGKQPERLIQFLTEIKTLLQDMAIQTLGPAPAPMARKACNYQMQLLLKAAHRQTLQQSLTILRQHLATTVSIRGIRWSIDRDPADLM
jgi:primosomal protein N' (replication factor Y)